LAPPPPPPAVVTVENDGLVIFELEPGLLGPEPLGAPPPPIVIVNGVPVETELNEPVRKPPAPPPPLRAAV
jgi:hypothetical protein